MKNKGFIPGKNRTLFFFILIQLLVLASSDASGSVPSDYIPVSPGEVVLHQYYILSYNENAEQANWVLYEISADRLNGGNKRKNNFRIDPLVSTGSATLADYIRSGFDRGHLCPAGDMSFDSVALSESFFMSNISPQNPGFNRGIWLKLENRVREWANVKKHLLVITGPVFKPAGQVIGKNEVQVPASFYKLIFDENNQQVIAFLMPNQSSVFPLENYTTTIDSLEKVTGIDFFSQLPDNIENQLESEIVLSGWFEEPTTELPKSGNKNILIIVLMVVFAVFILFQITRKR